MSLSFPANDEDLGDGPLRKHQSPSIITKQGKKFRVHFVSFLHHIGCVMVPFGRSLPSQQQEQHSQADPHYMSYNGGQVEQTTNESRFLKASPTKASSVQSRATEPLGNCSHNDSEEGKSCSSIVSESRLFLTVTASPMREKHGVGKNSSHCIDLDDTASWAWSQSSSSPSMKKCKRPIDLDTCSEYMNKHAMEQTGNIQLLSFNAQPASLSSSRAFNPMEETFDELEDSRGSLKTCGSATTTSTEQTGEIQLVSIYAQPSCSMRLCKPLEETARIDDLEDSRGSQKSLLQSSCESMTSTSTEQTGDIRHSIYAQPSFLSNRPVEETIEKSEDSQVSQKSLLFWSQYAPLAKDGHHDENGRCKKAAQKKPAILFLDDQTSFAVDIVLEEPAADLDDELEMEPPIFARDDDGSQRPILPWEMTQFVNRQLYPCAEVEEEDDCDDDNDD